MHMNWSGCDLVEVVPGKVSGVPVVKGTRVPADQIILSLESGETVEQVAFNYDLQPADVQALRSYREHHRAA